MWFSWGTDLVWKLKSRDKSPFEDGVRTVGPVGCLEGLVFVGVEARWNRVGGTAGPWRCGGSEGLFWRGQIWVGHDKCQK